MYIEHIFIRLRMFVHNTLNKYSKCSVVNPLENGKTSIDATLFPGLNAALTQNVIGYKTTKERITKKM